MGRDAAEVAREQAYFDEAARHRERRRDALADLPAAGAHPGTAPHLKRYAETAAAALGPADTAVAFGRIETGAGDRTYIGRHLIVGDDDVLVVGWQAPAAAPYFEASPADPHGVRRKRTFVCDANTIRDLTDVDYGEPAGVDDALLQELARSRTGTMRDIVATIQAAQYDVIRTPRERLLVIEGGPGTGKTAVALHRVSWLLYHHREQMAAADVLVVGPHPTFMRYVSEVLPGLGDGQVELRHVGELAPDVRRGRTEPAAVARLKGEARAAALLSRALRARIGAPEPAERLLLAGRFVTVPGTEVAEIVAGCAATDLPYAAGRQLLRERLTGLVRDRSGIDPTGQDSFAHLLERLWPQQSAAGLVRDLLASRRRLTAAGGDDFTAAQLARLHRRGADRISEEVWSAADLPLLDEAAHLIHGTDRRYAHVVVDEAQDLSPMQLRSVARRCPTGSLTVVGDLAQSTGEWARDSWQEVTDHLPEVEVTVRPLRYGYRVPRQVYEYAARLLPVAAPAVTPPEVVREGPAEPGIHRVELAQRAGRVAALAADLAAGGAFVGVVCPARCRREVEAALNANGVAWGDTDRGELGPTVNLVGPHEAKGLEFDAVVVVEPEQIVDSDERGHRLLYVALTRTTRRLEIVCVGEPLPLTRPARVAPATNTEVAGFTARDRLRLAEYLAGRVRGAAPPESWPELLADLARELELP